MDSDDWRLQGQERYLRGARFKRVAYQPPSARWDHDHCEFCWLKFAGHGTLGDVAHEGWRSEDEYRWVCDACFANFREPFGFAVFDGVSRRGIELHDARVLAIANRAGIVTIELVAFVHDDRDDESGDGQWQRVALDFHEASSELRGSPGAELTAGSVRVNDHTYENVLPIPLRESGSITGALAGAELELGVTARHVRIRLGAGTD